MISNVQSKNFAGQRYSNSNQKNNINFRWACSTHKSITQKVLSKVNNTADASYKFTAERIVNYCTIPDNDKALKANPHIADVDKNHPKDAYSMFLKFQKQAFKAVRNKKIDDFEKNAAIAVHYLQDVLNPYHARRFQSNSRQTKEVAIKHRDFEDVTTSYQEGVTYGASLGYKKSNLSLTNFIKHKMRKTKSLVEQLDAGNIDKESAIKQSLKNATEASLEFFYDLHLNVLKSGKQKDLMRKS